MLRSAPASPLSTATPAAAVTVRAPGRLHLGFLDPSASLGRAFGSLGLVIDGYETALELRPAGSDSVIADSTAAQRDIERAAAHLQTLRARTGRHQPLRLRLVDVLPAHAGFGSGTQLALAVGHAFARLHRLDFDSPTLARWLGRGARSGIGIAGFDHGGLLLDGGPGADGRPAPLLSQLQLPDAWRVVVVQDTSQTGLHGSFERVAIGRLAPLPRARAAEICHEVLMRVLPGAAGGEFASFAEGVTRIQSLLGEHFAPAQGGSAYTSAAVGRLVEWIGEWSRAPARAEGRGEHGAGIGQSSWGPTGFAILPSAAAADAGVAAARAAGLIGPELEVRVVRPRQRGATVDLTALGAPAR